MRGVFIMIEYRRANAGDIDELVRLKIEFMKEALKIETCFDDKEMKDSLTDYFNKTIHNDSLNDWLAIDNSRIIGTSGLCFYTLPPSYKNITGNVAYIMNMYTDPAYRGKGIASQLFEKMIFEVKKLGHKKISLHATDKGKPVYLKYGLKKSIMKWCLI